MITVFNANKVSEVKIQDMKIWPLYFRLKAVFHLPDTSCDRF